jgi:hypothetical protein
MNGSIHGTPTPDLTSYLPQVNLVLGGSPFWGQLPQFKRASNETAADPALYWVFLQQQAFAKVTWWE